MPESATGQPRFCDAPLDDAVRRLVEHIRDFRPDIIVTHDAYGGRQATRTISTPTASRSWPPRPPRWWGCTRTRVRLGARSLYLATHPYSALESLARLIGPRRTRHGVPDDQVDVQADVTPWLDTKVAAILAHRSEVRRGALPGLVAGLAPDARAELLGTEWFLHREAT